MSQQLDDIEVVIFDTETTGLEPKNGDRIVELAAIRLKGQAEIARFETFVDPGRQISEAAFRVNQISAQMLEGAPRIEAVLPKFLDFIKGACLCSYNAGFDMGFLNRELEILGNTALEDALVVDILKMSRRLLPGLERYALWFVAEKLGVSVQQEHRALSDVKLTAEVFQRLKDLLKLKGIDDLKNFSHLFGINPRLLENMNNQKINQIQEAMDLGVRVRIKYLAASNNTVSEREVIPKEIRKENNHYYLVGHCCLRNEERSFRIDGILHLEII